MAAEPEQMEQHLKTEYQTDLDKLFYPESIAIFGVSKTSNNLGGASYMRKLLESGYAGRIYPINPRGGTIYGRPVFKNLPALPETPDFAIVCVAAKLVPGILEDCAAAGLSHIHILSAGFSELGNREGVEIEAQVTALSKRTGLKVVGPNCMGTYCPAAHLTAWGEMPGFSGPIGIISQSGGITQRLTEYISSLGIGVAKAVSIGNAAVLTAHDYLAYMAEDSQIEVIALYLESIKDGPGLLKLVRRIGRKKPIVLLKGRDSEAGATTVVSHTGSMAGRPAIWRAFSRQTGAVQVGSLNEWVDAMMAFSLLPRPNGKGVFIIGGGGGNSVTYSDICVRQHLSVPGLSDESMQKLRQLVPAVGSIAGNPLDLFSVFQNASVLSELLSLACDDPAVDMMIIDRLIPRRIYHLPDLPDSTPDVIRAIRNRDCRKPVVVTLDSDGGDDALSKQGTQIRRRFCVSGIPAYPSIGRAAKALACFHQYHEWKSKSG